MPGLRITEFTDPACPFAWSAEPHRRRLEWVFGDQLEWELRMVGLSRSPEEYTDKGFTPEQLSASLRTLAERHHMPIDTSLRPRMFATVPACRAVVAARLRDPQLERPLLRRLRVRHFSGELLDERGTLEHAGADVGIAASNLFDWMDDPSTERALEEDLSMTRRPTTEAVALKHKLASWAEGWRYTCPSYEIVGLGNTARLSVPGFQPIEAYEVAIANLLPDAERRGDPSGVEEVLAWAGESLATAEVAAVCAIELEQAREELGRVATETHLGFDGLWSLPDVSGAGG
jgi:predicted DsbA family dithiol-disulfide isomerase